MTRERIINDPVFGFVSFRHTLHYDILQHPLMQRLSRVNQLGLASVVYPGARHTRLQHSLGAFYLMQNAIASLQSKGQFIFDSEEEAVEAAILMHDIGHGPFSHVLESSLISGISHEDISLLMMERMNKEMGGALNLAISIFKDEYPKRFLHQLISSQLDMDRLDYLRRDSFYTGVREGSIGSDRIIKMLNVMDDRLVVDYKGISSIENYLTSRWLMYWQVYLHKTAVGCENVLRNAILRARELHRRGREVFASPSLAYFIRQDIDRHWFTTHPEALDVYASLDDSDIWCALKVWAGSDDKVLSALAGNMINRRLFKTEVHDQPIGSAAIEELKQKLAEAYGISTEDASYFVCVNDIHKEMYGNEGINVLFADGTVKDVSEASQLLNAQILSKKIRKYYLSYQRI